MWEQLSSELIISILHFVPVKELTNVSLANKSTHEYCECEILWRLNFLTRFGEHAQSLCATDPSTTEPDWKYKYKVICMQMFQDITPLTGEDALSSSKAVRCWLKQLTDFKFLPHNHTPLQLAKLLFEKRHQVPNIVDEVLCPKFSNLNDLGCRVLKEYMSLLPFAGLDIHTALRYLSFQISFPRGSVSHIDKIIDSFSNEYFKQNPGIFRSADSVYVLCFSLIMLNVDMYNPTVRNKMTKSQFVRSNIGINQGGNIPQEYLERLYDSAMTEEISFRSRANLYLKGRSIIKQATLQFKEASLWSITDSVPMWCVLADKKLYLFHHRDASVPEVELDLSIMTFSVDDSSRTFTFSQPTPIFDKILRNKTTEYSFTCANQLAYRNWVERVATCTAKMV